MLSLRTKIANFARQRRQWETLLRSMPRTQSRARDFDPAFDRLTEVTGFGSNPGALRMFKYVPVDPQPALVVVLHGCTQTAASYDFGAGWSTLADRHGFMLLLPEQQRTNNAKNCFNWFLAGDIERGRGEASSIVAPNQTANNNPLKRKGDVDQQPYSRLEPVGLLGAARSHSSLESARASRARVRAASAVNAANF